MNDKPKVVTDLSTFYRVKVDDHFVYFPEENWVAHRAKFDTTAVDRMTGFGVYDTRVSSTYAIGLYTSKEEAMNAELPAITGTSAVVDEIARHEEVDSSSLRDAPVSGDAADTRHKSGRRSR